MAASTKRGGHGGTGRDVLEKPALPFVSRRQKAEFCPSFHKSGINQVTLGKTLGMDVGNMVPLIDGLVEGISKEDCASERPDHEH
jgi:hypothetical protein